MSLVGTKGGSGVWQRIISEMPEHDIYIEPFWGRGTLAAKKLPALTIGIDRDPAAVESGRVLGAKMFLADGVQWLKDYFDLSSPAARSSDAAGGGVLRIARPTPRPKAAGDRQRDPVPPKKASAAGVAMNGVARATPHLAALATFGCHPFTRHFVYLDPPYLGCHGHYKHELTTAGHADLLSVFLDLPCPAAISGYWTELYWQRLSGCRFIKIPTVNRAGKRVWEVLWMNYPQPARYHDTRFVGVCRRSRERIRRRVRNWRAGLGAMTAAERQAVWEACDAEYRGNSC